MKKIKAPEMYCRTMFCKKCKARGSPKVGDLFMLYGRKTKQLLVYRSNYRTTGRHSGYTPHLINYLYGTYKEVTFEAVCLMHECGIELNPSQTKENVWDMKYLRKETFTIPVKDWEELLKYKDDDYYLDIH